jgi:glycogen operon protein
VRRCIAARLKLPTLRNTHFLASSAKTLHGVPDIGWFDETGSEMTPERWNFSEGRLLALRRIAGDGRAGAGTVCATLLLLNAFSEDREFVLPQPVMAWRTVIDAAEPSESHSIHPASHRQPEYNKIIVAAHSAILLEADHVHLA